MTSGIAIRARGLGKEFRIGERRQPYRTLRETLAGAARYPFRWIRHRKSREEPRGPSTIWALKDLTLDIREGEAVGIIGRNGAGKSTLLKILCRITEPTAGYAEVRGRVGSLLEVGTGFHPELTGRENVYLNASILGMKRLDIRRKFDEIVAFAEVEKFIDTPVKHYSSGMYLRLAFAVAAHLEPDILIVDEVLAVGDARFQRKCLGAMQNAGQQGRTVLFVSHNMPAITRLCERAILLDGGLVARDGPPADVVAEYLSSGLGTTAAREWIDPEECPGRGTARLWAVRVRNENGEVSETFERRRPVRVEMEYEVRKSGFRLVPYFSFSNDEGVVALSVAESDPGGFPQPRAPGRYVSTVWIPGDLLAEGRLFVAAGLTAVDPVRKQFFVRDVVAFQVTDDLDRSSAPDRIRQMDGLMRPVLEWNTDLVQPPRAVEAAP